MGASVGFLRRRATIAAVTLVATAAFASPAVAANPAQQLPVPVVAPPPVPILQWTDCGGGFQCATARVPLDYNTPTVGNISLALIRLPAVDQGRKIGSLFVNPGGPGGSGVEFVRALGSMLFTEDVRAHFDIVGFDPRGIGSSTPLRCFNTFDEALAVLPQVAFPVTGAEEQSWVALDRALGTACKTHAGAIRDHMATADVARDLDLLRSAVGDETLNYVGYSYGSYLGATYANLFPNRVRALVVDGVPDPVAWATGRGNESRTQPFSTRLGSDESAYATLRQFFKLCDVGGPNCAFSAGDPEQRFAALAYRLYFNPLQLAGLRFTYADLISNALGALYSPSSWPGLANLLEGLDTLANPQTAADAARALRAQLGAIPREEYPNVVEGFPGVACSDSVNPTTVDAWPRAAAAADERHPYFGRLWTWVSSICQPWPGVDEDRYLGPFTQRTRRRVLIVGNRFDPATPYRGAETLDNLLPNSRLLTLEGWGHTSLFASSCVDAYVSKYLLTGSAPSHGTTCRPDAIPFAQPATASRAAVGPSAAAALVPQVIRRAIGGQP